MSEVAITKEQIQSVKGKGFLYNKGTRAFSARIITENGVLTSEQMQVVAQAAKQFGNGNIALTVRLTAELQGIPFEKIPDFLNFIEERGLVTGGTGAKVRPVVACKGTTCTNGLCDTFSIGTAIHKRFYEGYRDVALPHKFKIAIGGCPNNCVKPNLNDIGIVAVQAPAFILENCRGCTKCNVVENCPQKAATVENGKLKVDFTLCSDCGTCAKKCYFSAVKPTETQYKVYVGGRWGKRIRHGSLFTGRYSEEEALEMIEKAILLFKKEGIKGERFGEIIDRIGVQESEKMMADNTLLLQKNSIIEEPSKVGVKC